MAINGMIKLLQVVCSKCSVSDSVIAESRLKRQELSNLTFSEMHSSDNIIDGA